MIHFTEAFLGNTVVFCEWMFYGKLDISVCITEAKTF